ncbi:TPA: hypothetical protein ACH3X2_007136 [Trebouxia sp. C0005]
MEDSQAKDCGLLGILPEQPTAWQSCPCCWKTCQAATGDACLGVTHLRSAAKNMHGIAAFYHTGPFLPDDAAQHFLPECCNLAAGFWEPPSCVDFKAVGTSGRRAGVLDIFGMVALLCWHEFTMVAANLFTEENFAYYDLMLDTIRQHYHDGTERRLVHHPGETESHTAIGPWHARVHKTACQRQFGARCTPESGLTYKDNVEHLWSTLRKTAHLLNYMSMAHRQDGLSALVSAQGLQGATRQERQDALA